MLTGLGLDMLINAGMLKCALELLCLIDYNIYSTLQRQRVNTLWLIRWTCS